MGAKQKKIWGCKLSHICVVAFNVMGFVCVMSSSLYSISTSPRKHKERHIQRRSMEEFNNTSNATSWESIDENPPFENMIDSNVEEAEDSKPSSALDTEDDSKVVSRDSLIASVDLDDDETRNFTEGFSISGEESGAEISSSGEEISGGFIGDMIQTTEERIAGDLISRKASYIDNAQLAGKHAKTKKHGKASKKSKYLNTTLSARPMLVFNRMKSSQPDLSQANIVQLHSRTTQRVKTRVSNASIADDPSLVFNKAKRKQPVLNRSEYMPQNYENLIKKTKLTPIDHFLLSKTNERRPLILKPVVSSPKNNSLSNDIEFEVIQADTTKPSKSKKVHRAKVPKQNDDKEVPVFAENYHASGVLILPHSSIAEPFEIWYAPSLKKSRIDYYYGTDKTFQRADHGSHGILYKYVPMYTDAKGSFDGCWTMTGTLDRPVIPQVITPNMTWFTYNTTTVYTGTLATRWTYEYTAFGMRNHQTVWVTKAKPHRPIRYEMFGFDMMLGSYYDHYVINYISFSNFNLKEEEVFNLPSDISCFSWKRSLESALLANPMEEFAAFTPDKAQDIAKRYNAYKEKHQKESKTTEEDRRRTHIFKHNARYINSHNRKSVQYKLKANHFLDQLPDELEAVHGSLTKDTKNHRGMKTFTEMMQSENESPQTGEDRSTTALSDEIPTEIDWRDFGAVTGVKGQGVCSGCYAFTAAGAAEGAWYRKTGKLVEVSSQQLVDCSWGYGNHGCKGGHYAPALSWIFTHGVSTDSSYGKYLAQEGYCHLNDTWFGANIDGFSYIQPYNISALKRVVAKHGPVAASINSKPLSFKFYSKGIYSDPECLSNQTHHSVLIVGYGTKNGKDYWIVKNSWSSSWGEAGYMKLAMEDHLCGITENPIAVLVKNPEFQVPVKGKLTNDDVHKILNNRRKNEEKVVHKPYQQKVLSSNTLSESSQTPSPSPPPPLTPSPVNIQLNVQATPQPSFVTYPNAMSQQNTNGGAGYDNQWNAAADPYNGYTQNNQMWKKHGVSNLTSVNNATNVTIVSNDESDDGSSVEQNKSFKNIPETKKARVGEFYPKKHLLTIDHPTPSFLKTTREMPRGEKDSRELIQVNSNNNITIKDDTVKNRSENTASVNFLPFLGLHIEDMDKGDKEDDTANDEIRILKKKLNNKHHLGGKNAKPTNKIFLDNDIPGGMPVLRPANFTKTQNKETEVMGDKNGGSGAASEEEESSGDGEGDRKPLEKLTQTNFATVTPELTVNKELKEKAKERILKNQERLHNLIHNNLKIALNSVMVDFQAKPHHNEPESVNKQDILETMTKPTKSSDEGGVVKTMEKTLFDEKPTTFSSNDLHETPVLNPDEKTLPSDEKQSMVADSEQKDKPTLNPEKIGALNPEKISFQDQENDSKPTMTGTKKSVISYKQRATVFHPTKPSKNRTIKDHISHVSEPSHKLQVGGSRPKMPKKKSNVRHAKVNKRKNNTDKKTTDKKGSNLVPSSIDRLEIYGNGANTVQSFTKSYMPLYGAVGKITEVHENRVASKSSRRLTHKKQSTPKKPKYKSKTKSSVKKHETEKHRAEKPEMEKHSSKTSSKLAKTKRQPKEKKKLNRKEKIKHYQNVVNKSLASLYTKIDEAVSARKNKKKSKKKKRKKSRSRKIH